MIRSTQMANKSPRSVDPRNQYKEVKPGKITPLVTPMINLLYVIDQLHTGGAERQLFELAKRLDRRIFNPKVCAVWAGGNMERLFAEAGVEVAHISKRRRWDFSFPVKLGAFVRSWPVHIVHTILPTANVWGSVGAVIGGAQVLIASERAIRNSGDLWYTFTSRLLKPFTHGYIVNSQRGARHWERQLKLPLNSCSTILNGVDFETYGAKPLTHSQGLLSTPKPDPAESSPVIAVVARLSPEKCPEVFISAAKILHNAGVNCRFAWIGDGPSRQESEFRVRNEGLGSKFTFFGEQKNVAHVLSGVKIVVLCSRYEGLPNALIEAMALGKGIVATNVGGVSEVIDADTTGLLVPESDPVELAKAIATLLNSPSEALRLGTNAKAVALERFSMSRMVRETEDFYKKTAANRGVSCER